MCFGIHRNTAGGDTIFIYGERGGNAVHVSNTDHSKIFVYPMDVGRISSVGRAFALQPEGCVFDPADGLFVVPPNKGT